MANEIAGSYIAALSEFFALSDPAAAVKAPPKDGADILLPSFLPPGTNSLTTCHYMLKILGEITDCVNDITGLDLGSEATAMAKDFMEAVRWKFEETVCVTWLRGEPCN